MQTWQRNLKRGENYFDTTNLEKGDETEFSLKEAKLSLLQHVWPALGVGGNPMDETDALEQLSHSGDVWNFLEGDL